MIVPDFHPHFYSEAARGGRRTPRRAAHVKAGSDSEWAALRATPRGGPGVCVAAYRLVSAGLPMRRRANVGMRVVWWSSEHSRHTVTLKDITGVAWGQRFQRKSMRRLPPQGSIDRCILKPAATFECWDLKATPDCSALRRRGPRCCRRSPAWGRPETSQVAGTSHQTRSGSPGPVRGARRRHLVVAARHWQTVAVVCSRSFTQ
jgi:hypothetical protein